MFLGHVEKPWILYEDSFLRTDKMEKVLQA